MWRCIDHRWGLRVVIRALERRKEKFCETSSINMTLPGEKKGFIFTKENPIRLDKYLAEVLPLQSRSRIQDLIKTGFVKMNGDTAYKPSTPLTQGGYIEIEIPFAQPTELIPEDIPLDIIYEDENVIIVNKPAGMVVHPAHGHQTGTMVQALLAHTPFLQGIGGVQRPGIVHRLDRDTLECCWWRKMRKPIAGCKINSSLEK
jgi:23S rRNA-/tRNA-specific pseudouridylate synthase